MPISLHPSLGENLRLGYLRFAIPELTDSPPELIREMETVARAHRHQFQNRLPSQIPELGAARRLYRAMGMDPTRVRPSSEALLRRALKKKPLYQVNNVVDAGNLFSLEQLYPVGLYDEATIDGPISARLGEEGETYQGIRRGSINLRGRVALFDRVGPFGNPSADSLRTCISAGTRRVLLVVFAPGDVAPSEVDRLVARAGELQEGFAGGTLLERGQIPPGAAVAGPGGPPK